ncbi:MAG: hypothetical protein H6605_02045 [Flavobacteriales bacterium]|nr:hypothetical protein [Flavobacteriales bacterium]
MKSILILLFTRLIFLCPCEAQDHNFEIGLGTKYDRFTVDQSSDVFDINFDIGALAYLAYGKEVNEKIRLLAGFATNNYKLSTKVSAPGGTVFSSKEVVHVMRSNRMFLNCEYFTKKINYKTSWVNGVSVSLLVGAKNPSDMPDQRSSEIQTDQGLESVQITINTKGLTGSSILLGAFSKIYHQINKDFKLALTLGFFSGTGEMTRVEMNYLLNNSQSSRKAIFKSNGFTSFLTFGVHYTWFKEDK